jgi:hypothetical protein
MLATPTMDPPPAPTNPSCRHCGRARVNRPRGLCWTCYHLPGVRDLYPSTSKFVSRVPGRRCATTVLRAARPVQRLQVVIFIEAGESGAEQNILGDQITPLGFADPKSRLEEGGLTAFAGVDDHPMSPRRGRKWVRIPEAGYGCGKTDGKIEDQAGLERLPGATHQPMLVGAEKALDEPVYGGNLETLKRLQAEAIRPGLQH